MSLTQLSALPLSFILISVVTLGLHCIRSNDKMMKFEFGLVLTSPNIGTIEIVLQKYCPSTVLIGIC